MSMTDWAKREIEIACERERAAAEQDEDGIGAEYGVACYESAYKAYKSLTEDGHSGFSIGITKQILNRLIDGKPLTPIEDNWEDWEERDWLNDRPYTSYQCRRMSSLFKDVHSDGSVSYKDISRFVGVNKTNGTTWHSGLVDRILHEMYPVTMPYMSPTKPYMVYCDDCLTDGKNGDFDTYEIDYVITPEGQRVNINRYFKDSSENETGWEEISLNEYLERKIMDKQRREELKKDVYENIQGEM